MSSFYFGLGYDNRMQPYAVVAQMAERLVANEKAVGPNPSYCTIFRV